MASRSRSPRSLLLAALLPAAMAVLQAGADAPASSMTNEAIVRLSTAGLSSAEIVRRIQEAPRVDFDLDPDVVRELALAGVAPEVIEAMRAAQGKRAAPAAQPAGPGPAPAFPVDLFFDRDAKQRPERSTASAPAKDFNDRPVKLALYVVCLDPLHVPDGWMDSPVSAAVPRHHLLWFHDALAGLAKGRNTQVVSLDLPAAARFDLEAGSHPVEVGVVARAGELDWQVVSKADATLSVREGHPARLVVRLRSKRATPIRMAFGPIPYVTCEIIDPLPAGRPAP